MPILGLDLFTSLPCAQGVDHLGAAGKEEMVAASTGPLCNAMLAEHFWDRPEAHSIA
jgi:hypothetical protein